MFITLAIDAKCSDELLHLLVSLKKSCLVKRVCYSIRMTNVCILFIIGVKCILAMAGWVDYTRNHGHERVESRFLRGAATVLPAALFLSLFIIGVGGSVALEILILSACCTVACVAIAFAAKESVVEDSDLG